MATQPSTGAAYGAAICAIAGNQPTQHKDWRVAANGFAIRDLAH